MREEVNSSSLIFTTLASMLLGQERHQECLVKVINLLSVTKISMFLGLLTNNLASRKRDKASFEVCVVEIYLCRYPSS